METIIDLETLSKSESELACLEPQFEAPGNYKAPEAIAKYCAEAKSKWRDNAALRATTGTIAILGTLTEEVRQFSGDECEIISAFWETWSRGGKVIGFNIKGWDLPFLCQRSWCLGIEVPTDIREGRWWSTRIIDLLEIWACYTNRIDGFTLDAVCRACGLGGKLDSGANFSMLWNNKREAAFAYNAHELELIRSLAVRLGVIKSQPPF